MLEKLDLSKTLAKPEYKKALEPLELRLGKLQRKAKEMDIPVMIVFEGWDAAGKGTLINRLILAMDPRGYKVHTIISPDEEETLRPYMWRYWMKLPARGRMAIFDRSWYRRVLTERVRGTTKKKIWSKTYQDIASFERQLTADGMVIIKFFLHITRQEQKKRFKKLESDPATAWRVTKDDWNQNKHYRKYADAAEEMLSRTDSEFAPWTLVESHDARLATVKIFQRVVDALEGATHAAGKRPDRSVPVKASSVSLEELDSSILDKADLSLALSREKYDRAREKCQDRLGVLAQLIHRRRIPVVIVYSGWDAAGKGGNIRRLVRSMDPRGYEVIPIGAPNDIEKAYHYLWRFWIRMPKAGHIAVFDRSWYGRVMVERIEGFCSDGEWKRAYREINEMEQQLVDSGVVLVKFWIHIDSDEQLRRFESRRDDPNRRWKITEEDWRNREKREQYRDAVDEMLFRTSTRLAPWTIVESNCKWYARIKAMKTVIREIEKKLKRS